jgi:hypothetical protein
MQLSGRGRGRPKKENGDIYTNSSTKAIFNPLTMDFFKSSDKNGEVLNVENCLKEIFEDLNSNLNSNLNEKDNENKINNNGIYFKLTQKTKNCKDYLSHTFIKHILENLANSPTLDLENSKCDEVFAEYIIKISKIVNENFFAKVVKFVFLFRECLNVIHRNNNNNNDNDNDNHIENEDFNYYSEITNAEDAPDISNDFVTDYLDINNLNDCEKYGFNREDAIDLTQNFCQWLYDNNYTCSKLSLINSINNNNNY